MNLYQEIFRRRSVRNYQQSKLSENKIAKIKKLVLDRKRLYPDVPSEVILVEDGPGLQNKLSGLIAEYGKIRAPHYLIGTSEERKGQLVDLGYSLEYIVLKMTAMGIGTCWIGKGFKDKELREIIDLPPEQKSRILVAFGPLPQGETLEEKENHNRKGLDHFLIRESEQELREDQQKILDALRRAPSAINGQPWRVSLRNKEMDLFIGIRSKITRMIAKSMIEMNQMDGGIGFSHLEIAGKKIWGDVETKQRSEMNRNGFKYVGSIGVS